MNPNSGNAKRTPIKIRIQLVLNLPKHPKFPSFLILALLLIFASTPSLIRAQAESQLSISMIRNFGTALGDNINGTFTIRTKGPDNLESVTFYLDSEPMGTVTTAPFNMKFNTDAYSSGMHTITAVGTTTDGQELQSNSITRNFLTSSDNTKSILLFVVPLILLIIAARFAANWISKRGQTSSPEVAAIDGLQGGTICPKCHKPFSRHWWGLNFGTSKYDRCPYCHKWSMVTRQPPELLQAALEAMVQAENISSKPSNDDDESSRKRHLDNSRFDS